MGVTGYEPWLLVCTNSRDKWMESPWWSHILNPWSLKWTKECAKKNRFNDEKLLNVLQLGEAAEALLWDWWDDLMIEVEKTRPCSSIAINQSFKSFIWNSQKHGHPENNTPSTPHSKSHKPRFIFCKSLFYDFIFFLYFHLIFSLTLMTKI